MGMSATFQRTTQFSLLLSCDSNLKSDWVFQLSGSGSNRLNSRKLPGRFSLPKWPGTRLQCYRNSTLTVASFPVPRPAFHRLQYILQRTKSWALDWVRGYTNDVCVCAPFLYSNHLMHNNFTVTYQESNLSCALTSECTKSQFTLTSNWFQPSSWGM